MNKHFGILLLCGLLLLTVGCGEIVKKTTEYETRYIEVDPLTDYRQTNFDADGVTTLNYTILKVNSSGYTIESELIGLDGIPIYSGRMNSYTDALNRVTNRYDVYTNTTREIISYEQTGNKELTHVYFDAAGTTINIYSFTYVPGAQKVIIEKNGVKHTSDYVYDRLNRLSGIYPNDPATYDTETFEYSGNSMRERIYRINGVTRDIIIKI
jgi:hypothetical protein